MMSMERWDAGVFHALPEFSASQAKLLKEGDKLRLAVFYFAETADGERKPVIFSADYIHQRFESEEETDKIPARAACQGSKPSVNSNPRALSFPSSWESPRSSAQSLMVA